MGQPRPEPAQLAVAVQCVAGEEEGLESREDGRQTLRQRADAVVDEVQLREAFEAVEEAAVEIREAGAAQPQRAYRLQARQPAEVDGPDGVALERQVADAHVLQEGDVGDAVVVEIEVVEGEASEQVWAESQRPSVAA